MTVALQQKCSSAQSTPSSSMLGVHMGCQRKERWKSSCWPRAGCIQLQETPSQLSHCAQVNEGSLLGWWEGTEAEAQSLSHRKIHRVFQEPMPHSSLCCRICSLKLLQAYSRHTAAVQGVRKCHRMDDCNLVTGTKPTPSFAHGAFQSLVSQLHLNSPNSTAPFHGFPLIFFVLNDLGLQYSSSASIY